MGPDLHHLDARRIGRKLFARPGQGLGHLRKDVDPPAVRLRQRAFEEVERERADLVVELHRGHPLRRAGHLEVHIAEVILDAEDVGEDRHRVPLLHQPHGDPGHGAAHRHPGIHQRQAAAADGGHRRRSVRLGDLRFDLDGVGKRLRRRQDRLEGAPREVAMTDLAASRAAQRAHLAHRVGRERVVELESLPHAPIDRLGLLLVPAGAESGDDERLCLAAGEERRAVHARDQSRLARDRPNAAGGSPVGAYAVLEDGAPQQFVFEPGEGLARGCRQPDAHGGAATGCCIIRGRPRRQPHRQLPPHRLIHGVHRLFALVFPRCAQRHAQPLGGQFADRRLHLGIRGGRRKLPLRLPRGGPGLLHERVQRPHGVGGDLDRPHQLGLGEFPRLPLHHDEPLRPQGNHQVGPRIRTILGAGEDQPVAVRRAGQAQPRHRTVEWDPGEVQRHRAAGDG